MGMWKKVQSSNVKEVEYDQAKKSLRVIYKAKPTLVYEYENVTTVTYNNMMEAESIGRFLHNFVHLKKQYTTYQKPKGR